jgi:hypothetical protein
MDKEPKLTPTVRSSGGKITDLVEVIRVNKVEVQVNKKKTKRAKKKNSLLTTKGIPIPISN